MQKTVHMYRLEERTGRDIRQLICEAVQRCGSIAGAAEEFGISRKGLVNWINALDGSVGAQAVVRFRGWEPAEERQPVEVGS